MDNILKTSIISGMAFMSSLGLAISQQASQTAENSEVMFVLDGSNSMWGQINGTAKISIAKDVMTDLIANLDPNINMGLMAYGHRRKNDCKDIEVLALPGPIDRQQMIKHVQNITPRGKTPLTQALFLGAFSLEYFTGKSSVVLVSDGLETCNADPCAQARSLEIVNPGFDVHVVGFDVTSEESRSLQCIADETGGKFFRANNANELKDALAQTLAAAVQGNNSVSSSADADGQGSDGSDTPTEALGENYLYAKLCETCERLDPLRVNWNVHKDGKPHYQGVGSAYSQEPLFSQGTYQVGARLGTSVVTASGEVEFGEDGEQIGELNLNAGNARIFAYATDDKTIPQGAFFRFFPIINGKVQDQLTEASGNDQETWLPAGKYKITAQINQIEESAEIEIIAGQETINEFDLRLGYIRPDVVLFEGGKINRGVFYQLFDAETGTEKAIATGVHNEPMPAKPGKYNLLVSYNSPNFIGRADIKFPVEIKAGETINGPYVLNVGRFEYNISSKSGLPIGGVWLQKVSEDGKSTSEFDFRSNAKYPGVAPEGTYRFRVRVGDNFPVTGPFEIVAGEVRELNIEFP
ncbi:vWA domain-containing protein [Lentilitoribacter sp. EG35]|uniref:vWA domain-containing protein n=1 Tax=Lentilitoribacter sp. EG35 TaxID=3234192 RepID=UPI00345FC73F